MDSEIPQQGQRDAHKWQSCVEEWPCLLLKKETRAQESSHISANESAGRGDSGSAFPGSLTHTATRWQQELSPNWGEVALLGADTRMSQKTDAGAPESV